MMKHKLFALLLLLGSGLLQAQTPTPRILCGNELFNQWIREHYPDLQAAFDQTFEAASNQPATVAERSPLKIKVVLHVVWRTAAENLPDSILLNQMRILNEDYNRLNADSSDLRAAFQAVAGSAGIEFELAEIVRVQTNQLFSLNLLGNDLLSKLKNSNQGGSDAWDTNKYLNIWICKIQPTTLFGIPIGQILGFAFPPNGLNNWPANSGAPSADEDGVVLDFRVCGSNNPYPLQNPAGGGNLIVKGRTATHEVGHYLGLRHIWGDGGLLGANDCDQSDGVFDTPFANAQSEFDCDKTKNTCTQTEPYYNADMPDLVENFMDYSSESCQNMFTKGQISIMRNVLMGPRKGLLTQSGTNQPEPVASGLMIAPNPAIEQSTISIQMPADAVATLTVFRATGEIVLQRTKQSAVAGPLAFQVDMQDWRAGMYWVEVQSAQERVSGKLIKY